MASSVGGKLGLALASVLFALLLLEGGVRWSGYDINIDPHWQYHPLLGWTMAAGPAIEGINGMGFRYPPLQEPKGEKKRLLILGDSFTAGASVPFQMTFPGRLLGWMNQGGDPHPWEVASLAVGDWGTAQQLIALREYGLAMQPDAVILQLFPFNDLCNNSLELAETCSLQDPHRPYLVEGPEGALQRVYVSGWRSRLRRFSHLFGLVENELMWRARARDGVSKEDRSRINQYHQKMAEKRGLPMGGALLSLLPEEKQPPAVKRAWRSTEAILRHLNQELSSRGIPLLAVVIPYVHTLPPLWERYARAVPPGLQPDQDTRTTEEILHRLGIPVISMRERILKGPMAATDYFLMPGDSHLNVYGHAAVAQWVLSGLRALGITGTHPPRLRETLDVLDPAEWRVALNGVTPPVIRDNSLDFYALGPDSYLAFPARQGGSRRLEMMLRSPLPEQEVKVLINGEEGALIPIPDPGSPVIWSLEFPVRAGRNEIRFEFSRWVGKDQPRGESGQRPLALQFQDLQIRAPLS